MRHGGAVSKVRVPIANTPSKVVTIESEATIGAILGVNLVDANGKVLTLADLRGSAANPGAGGSTTYPPTYWKLIQEVPPNIVALAVLTGAGYAYRFPDGTWQLRRSGRAVIPFAYGDATPADIYVPHEAGVLTLVRVQITTPFDGIGAAITLGTAADPDAFVTADDIDPAMAASWEVLPDANVAAGEPITLTLIPGTGATAGAGRILIDTFPLVES